jgi:hypothetical protein
MFTLQLALLLFAAMAALVLPAAGRAHAITRPAQTMYTPPSGVAAKYPRAIRLQSSGPSNGTLLATFSVGVTNMPTFPVFRSTDNGNTWTQISQITDTQNGWGMRWEPDLYELPTAIGGFPAGTVLAAGASVPPDRSAIKLDMYASTDHGVTWTFVSNIATGGEAQTTNGDPAVWEPFLMVSGSKLIAYYSDQRDPAHGQKLDHQTTTDGIHWGSVVNDVAMPTYTDRPGMATVAKLPNGKYVMTYEYGGSPAGNYAVYYKVSADPEGFNNVPGIPLRTTDGVVPSGTPVITWLPTGGPNGTLAVTAHSDSRLFLNTQNGAANTWTHVNSTVPAGYSRALLPLADGHSLEVINAASTVTYGTTDLGGGVSDGAVYTATNLNSKLKLTIAGGTIANGKAATQQHSDGAADQQWELVQQQSGYFTIRNMASGQVLGVQHQSTDNGAPVIQWDDTATLDHEWAVAPHPAGGYSLVNRISGKYLEIPNASTTVGTAADQWSDTGCSCQRWDLTANKQVHHQ